MPVPDQVRDDGAGIRNLQTLLDSGLCQINERGLIRPYQHDPLGKFAR